MTPNVHIVVLNWNGWRDTIECLESLFHQDYPDYTVVVCDNGSSDNSLQKIAEWANGRISAESSNPQLSHLIAPPHNTPISSCELTRQQVESNPCHYGAGLVLIQNGVNLGFAGGNNVGLRYALANPSCQYCWILNNDTVAGPQTLSAMVRLMQERPEIGLCGSLNLDYYNPRVVQARGGMTYNRWTGRVRKETPCLVEKVGSRPTRMDYVNGASMVASRAFLEEVGLMEESYFLYFEELDWAMRAKGKFTLGYASESVIYHKEGATTGTNWDRRQRSLLSDRYHSRNRVLFTRRFVPWALPTVLMSVCLTAIERLCTGDVRRSLTVMSCMLNGVCGNIPRTAITGAATEKRGV
ncbi:MAG: glycosyltransferase family 2 protein [Candidatus Sulfotelmatobacter sp.]